MTLAMAFASPLAAQSKPDKQRTIVVVVESPFGIRGASELRQALATDNCVILSPSEARRRSVEPDALLTVATDRARAVQVLYWDRDGRLDTLAAPAPDTAEQLSAVTLALSSALLERHRNDTPSVAAEIRNRARIFDDPRTSQAFYAMLGHVGPLTPRTNVHLRFEDF